MSKSRSNNPQKNLENDTPAPKTFYKDAEAERFGLAGNPETGAHGASRNPYTGLMLKLPGHDTVNLAVETDRREGYRVTQIGQGLSSFETSDPRLQTGSEVAPRDTDISGAIYESETKAAIAAGKAPRTEAARKKRAEGK